ncbi:MAG: acetyltransferase [Chitinophagaceae bacterium]
MSQRKIIIIGAGGHAAELRDYIGHMQKLGTEIQVEGFLDDDANAYAIYGYAESFLGSIADHQVRTDVDYLMGIANIKYRRPIIEKFEAAGASFRSLIHPTVLLSPSATLGKGVIISHNASVGPKVIIGDHNIINSRCTIGHDTVLGKYNFVSPQVAFSGHTTVGDENMIGVNSCTIPGLVIGNNNVIAAGTVLYKHVGDGQTLINRFNERIIQK